MPAFPCFSVFTDECRGPYLVKTESGNNALLVLTDEDLLGRFRKQEGVTGPTIRFEMAGQLVLYLDALPQDVTHIAFDPSVRGKAVTVLATELYQKLLQSLNP
jgi:hypothetical protein